MKNKIYYLHKDFVNISVSKLSDDEINKMIEAGWKPGKHPAHWINNGEEQFLLKEGQPLPDGFEYGVLLKTKNKCKEQSLNMWANMNEAQKEHHKTIVSKCAQDYWDNITEQQKFDREEKRLNTRAQWSEEEKQAYSQTMSESAKKDRAQRTAEQYKQISAKGFETRRNHKTLNTSKYEIDFYNFLKLHFDENDIYKEYVDERYPYHCDFYIKSLDLFIELNIHFTHGEHPFDINNKDDIRELQKIQSKQYIDANGKKNFYYKYEEVWTIRDIQKINTATHNKLNYIMLYNEQDIYNFKENVYEIKKHNTKPND